MITPDLTMHVGDTMPSLQLTLRDADGNGVDLSGAVVTVSIRGLTVEYATTTGSATGDDHGNVTYLWNSGPLPPEPGYYSVIVTAVWGNEQQSFPEIAYVLAVLS